MNPASRLNRMRMCLLVLCVLGVVAGLGLPAEAQTVQYIGPTCVFSWSPNAEPDLAGYRAFAVQGATQRPVVTIAKTATSHPTSTTCAALGVNADGVWTFNVLAFDLAGNASNPSVITATRDTIAPTSPANPSVSSPQPIAMTITPNPEARQATVAWIPGSCQQEYVVHRLISGRWVEIGRTHDTWMDVPLINQVNQPYGVSAVCEG